SLARPFEPTVPTTNSQFYRVNRDPQNFNVKLLNSGTTYEFSVTAVSTTGFEGDMSNVFVSTPRFGNPENKKPKFPILFLHGITSTSKTWGATKTYLMETWGWTFGGDLSVIRYNEIFVDNGLARICAFD